MSEKQCDICGKYFEFNQDYKRHKSDCGVSKLTESNFTEHNSSLKFLEALGRKVRSNKDTITDNSTQRTLRNHKVRQNKLNNF